MIDDIHNFQALAFDEISNTRFCSVPKIFLNHYCCKVSSIYSPKAIVSDGKEDLIIMSSFLNLHAIAEILFPLMKTRNVSCEAPL